MKQTKSMNFFGIKWFVVYTLLIMIPLVVVGMAAYHESTETIEDNLIFSTQQLLGVMKDSMNCYVAGTENFFLDISKEVSVLGVVSQSETGPVFNDYVNRMMNNFRKALETNQDIKNIYLGTEDKKIYIYPEADLGENFDPMERNWYKQAVKENGLVWTQPYVDRASGEKVVTLAIPLYAETDDKRIAGVIGIDITLAQLFEKMDSTRIGKNGYLVIIDESDRALMHKQTELIEQKLPIDEISEDIKQKSDGYVEYERIEDGKNYNKFGVFTKNDKLGLILFSAMYKDEIMQDARGIFRIVLIVGLVSLLMAIGISLVFSNSLTQMVKRLLYDVEQKSLELSRKNEELDFSANYDDLTGVANRKMLNRCLQSAIEKARENNTKLAILFMDLDRFKNVNDFMGYHVGDQLLILIVQRLKKFLGERYVISRQGGDEFTIILDDFRNQRDVAERATEILNLIKKPFVINNVEVNMTLSMGIARYPDDGESVDSLIKYANLAMYHAKEKGRNNFQIYDCSLSEKLQEEVIFENELHRALRNNEFKLYYQPIVNAETKEICGMEALIRWEHPKRGMVFPDEFIPVAEETGLIVSIGQWVLQEACQQAKIFYDRGWPLKVAVNISPWQFLQENLVEIIIEALKKADLPPKLLELEITEGVAIANEQYTVATLKTLKTLGIHISIDDFGTGYSSLSLLRKLPIHTLKIDRSFVKNIPVIAEDVSIVSAIIGMAKSLNLNMIAEGVEYDRQFEFLKEIGCQMIQGYLIGRPVPADVFVKNHLENIPVRRSS